MYIPKNLELKDQHAIELLINDFGFGLVVSPSLEASHLPLIYEQSDNGLGLLFGHMAKANKHWEEIEGAQVRVIFTGPHSYISPTWYAGKPNVPTWNYVAVHCIGKVELLTIDETLKSIDKLMAKYEPHLVEDKELMPEEYIARLSQAIIGFKVVITEIQAKEKLGQHRKQEDQKGVYKGLMNSGNAEMRALADYMTARGIGTGE